MVIVGQGSGMGRESVAPSGKLGRNLNPQHSLESLFSVFWISARRVRAAIGGL